MDFKKPRSNAFELVPRQEVENEGVNVIQKQSLEYNEDWLRDVIVLEQYGYLISNERLEQVKQSILRYIEKERMLYEKNSFNNPLFIDYDNTDEGLREYWFLKQVCRIEKGFLKKELEQTALGVIGFECRREQMLDYLIKNHSERLRQDYEPLIYVLRKGKWFNEIIMRLNYTINIKKALLTFCINIDARENNMQLKRDFEYIKNNKIDEVVLLENIKQAMEYKIGSDGKRYTWKALYLKEGVNV